METKFTPRPWQQNGSALYSADPQRELICVVYGAGVSGLLIDNLRLIAAAPDLYDALRRMERLVTELYPGDVEPDTAHIDEYKAVWSVVMDARTALAKAVTNG